MTTKPIPTEGTNTYPYTAALSEAVLDLNHTIRGTKPPLAQVRKDLKRIKLLWGLCEAEVKQFAYQK